MGIKPKHFILGLAAGLVLGTGSAHAAGKGAEKSCIAGGSIPAKIRVGQTGFQDEDITVVEGVSGPEVRIGKTTLFLSPSSSEDEKSTGGDPSRNNSWCVVDPELNRRNNAKPNDVNCSPFGYLKNDNSGNYDKPLQINGANGRPVAEIHAKEVKDENGKKMIQLVFKKLGSSDSRDKATNKLVITGHAKKEGQNVRTSLRLESRDFKDDKLNGLLESTILGRLAEQSGPNDPRGSDQFSSCKSPQQAKGQFKKSDNEAPENWVDLQGNHLVMRGNERYIQDQYRENRAPLHAEDSTGRGGGVS